MPINYRINAPNGSSESFAILNHCGMSGIPTSVIADSIALNNAETVSIIPKVSDHTRLLIGYSRKFVTTPLPKGFHTNQPIFKHLTPSGKPITVRERMMPILNHITEYATPPNIFQIKFPVNRYISLRINT